MTVLGALEKDKRTWRMINHQSKAACESQRGSLTMSKENFSLAKDNLRRMGPRTCIEKQSSREDGTQPSKVCCPTVGPGC